jgi:hypothetical protein
MKDVKTIRVSIDELISIHKATLSVFQSAFETLKTSFPHWENNSDCRLITINLIKESLQSCIITLSLIKDGFEKLSIWGTLSFSSEDEKRTFLTNRLYFLVLDMQTSLFVNVFVRYEHFIRLIGQELSLHSNSINELSKKVRSRLNLELDFDNLIDIFAFSRNTVHFGGVHTKSSVTINYNMSDYNFIQNEHLAFFDDNTFHFLLTEISKFISKIVNADEISAKTKINHIYSDFTFT